MKNSILKLSYFIGLTLFIQAPANAGCVINTDLSCLATANSPWPAKTKEERLLLVLSSDVQNNPANCSLFGQLIKTECGISKPVIATYFSSNQKKTDTYIISDEREIFQNISTLPNTFQKYFNQQLRSATQFTLVQSFFGKTFEKSAEAFYKFLTNESPNDQLELPYACQVNPTPVVNCRLSVQCKSNRADGKGNILVLKKVTSGLNCEDIDKFYSAFYTLQNIKLPEDEEGLNLVSEQAAVSNYAGFGHMPVLNQSDAWLSGLFLDKYGVDYTRQGVCVATSAAMMALGLKRESPGSVLNNQFDIIPNEYGDGVAVVKDPAKAGLTRQLKYSHYATYIDEMLRWAGLLNDSQKRFPWYFDMYQKVFHKPLINFGIAVPWQSTSLSSASDTMHLNYLANRPIQDYFENNFKTWISQKKGVVVALQSVGLFMTEKFFEGPVGHASTVASYSGSTITILDPWGIVNQVKFDVHLDDIGIVQMPEYDECVAQINRLSADLKRIFTIENTCGAPPQNGFSLRAPDPRAMRVLEHVGAQAGYIGQRYLGVQNWYSGAYVNGYIVGNPWPAKMSKETYLANQVAKESSIYSNTCSPWNTGDMSVEGKWYQVRNSLSEIRAVNGVYSTNYTATVPVEAGCAQLREYLPNGKVQSWGSFLAGTFKMTCVNGKIETSDNKCKVINSTCPKDPNAFSVSFRAPKIEYIGLSPYYSSFGECVHNCNSNYVYDPNIKLCKLIPPSNLKYDLASYRLEVGGTYNTIKISTGGSAINATFSVTPSLPKGLTINKTLGTINGTPTVISPPTTYTVKATNTSGSFEFKVVIETFLKPPTLSYSLTQYNAKFRQAFNSIASPVKTGILANFSISPALPSGLTLSSSGTIVGTPTKQSPSQQYQVSLTNAGGVATSIITLGVYPAPSDIKFPGIVNGLVSTAFTSAPPTVYSTTPIGTTYAAVTPLPAGITINPATGVLSGSSPVKIFQMAVLSSSNIHGTYSYHYVVLNICSSSAIAPTGLKYLSPTFISVGKSIYLEPALGTGTEVGYTVNPSLPIGLNLSPVTGVIRGTVTTPIQPKTYRVTVSNKKGASYFDLKLEPEVTPVVYANAQLGVGLEATIKPSYTPQGATFSVSPALPQGLILNSETGEIHGYPQVAQASTNYTVSITSGGVTRTSVVAIAIENYTVPSDLTYNLNTLSVRVGTPVNLTPTLNSGGGTLTYTINHTLPDGLSLNPLTGVISGTPTAVKAADLYTITVQNPRGMTNGRIVIEVIP